MPEVSLRSRLRFSRYMLTVEENQAHWGFFTLPPIPEQPDDQVHRVRDFDLLTKLANRFYDDPTLWWVIARANDLKILPTDLNPGDELRIPSPRFILEQWFDRAEF